MSEKGSGKSGSEKKAPQGISGPVIHAIKDTELQEKDPDGYRASVESGVKALLGNFLAVQDGKIIVVEGPNQLKAQKVLDALAEKPGLLESLNIPGVNDETPVVEAGAKPEEGQPSPESADYQKAKAEFGTNLALLSGTLRVGTLGEFFKPFIKSNPSVEDYTTTAAALHAIYKDYMKDGSDQTPDKLSKYAEKVKELSEQINHGGEGQPTPLDSSETDKPVEDTPGVKKGRSGGKEIPENEKDFYNDLEIIYSKENSALAELKQAKEVNVAQNEELEMVRKQINSSGDDLTVSILRQNFTSGFGEIQDPMMRALFEREEFLEENIRRTDLYINEAASKHAAAAARVDIATSVLGNDIDSSQFLREALEAGISPQEAFNGVLVQEALNPGDGRAYGAVFAAIGWENMDIADRMTITKLIADKKIIITDNNDYLIPGDMLSESSVETRNTLIDITDRCKKTLTRIYFSANEDTREKNPQEKHLRALEISKNDTGGLTELIRMVNDQEVIAEVQELLEARKLKINLLGDVLPIEDDKESYDVYTELRDRLLGVIDVMQYNQTENEIKESIEADVVMAKAEIKLRQIQEELGKVEARLGDPNNSKYKNTTNRMVAYLARWIHNGDKFNSTAKTDEIAQYRIYEEALQRRLELSEEYNKVSVLISRTREELSKRVTGLVEVRSAFVENLGDFDSRRFISKEDFAAVDRVMLQADIANHFDNPPSAARDELALYPGVDVEDKDVEFEITVTDAEARELVSESVVDEIKSELKEKLEKYFAEICRGKMIRGSNREALIASCWDMDGYQDLFELYADKFTLQDGYMKYLKNFIDGKGLTIQDSAMVRTILGDIEELQTQKSNLDGQLKGYFVEFATRARGILGFESLKSGALKKAGKALHLTDEQAALLAGSPDFGKILESTKQEINSKIEASRGIPEEVTTPQILETEVAESVSTATKKETTAANEASGSDDTYDSSDYSAPVGRARSNVSSSLGSVGSRLASNKNKGGFLGFLKGLLSAALGF